MTARVLEICIDGVEGARRAARAGASRVELCSALLVGGLTPSTGMVEATIAAAGHLRVHVLIRPRAGDFVYDADESAVMLADIEHARRLGADGVVFGALTADRAIDLELCQRLVDASMEISVTFHRAFDLVAHPFAALEEIITLGADRLLTSGQDETALEGAPLIAGLVRAAAGRLIVMPGGGVNERNAVRILEATGANELHLSASTTEPSPVGSENRSVHMGGALYPPELDRRVTSEARIAATLTAIRKEI
jgi:copper homeostasis protein